MARDHDRMKEDHAGIGPEPGRFDRLHRLSESQHYRIAGGEPDIRGWEVRTLSGNHVGEVEDLLIDPHRGEVVMLDVDLNNSTDRINVPIRGVQLDRGRRTVIVDSGDISSARALGTAAVTRDDERERLDERERHMAAAGDRDQEGVDDRNEARDIRYGRMREGNDEGGVVEETVVERRPVIEEVVVRRRVVDEDE